MNFDSDMDTLMKPFLSSFGLCEKQPLNKDDAKIYQDILISLYKDIYHANETIFKAGCFQCKTITEVSEFEEPEGKNSRYFPSHIQNYISTNEKVQLIFTCQNVGEREITIIFTLFDEAELKRIPFYTQYVKMMYIWLHICGKYANKACTETLRVFIYPTPFIKQLPTNPATTIGPEHINTAFTIACAKNGQIILFREEEWFKVFIHETFHSYGLDFATNEHAQLKNILRSIFPINSDFDIYEAYTETWARIINCAFCSFNALPEKNKRDQKTFLSNFNFCLEMERMFAMYQCIKILGFMGLHYNDLYINSLTPPAGKTTYLRHLYKENTHVFAYYIMTAIFLNDQQGFLLWCKKNNKALLKFNATPENFDLFASYISSVYDCISLLKGMVQMGALNSRVNKTKNKTLSTSTRMSIIHTI
jgi:hypothetical protein